MSIEKKISTFFRDSIFVHQEHFLLERNTEIESNIEKKSIELKVLYSKKDLEELVKKGYTIGNYFKSAYIYKKFAKGQILFGIFINKKLIHTSWLIHEKGIEFHPPLKIDLDNESYVHFCITDPNYRGNGLYAYTLQKISEFLALNGKKKLKISIEKDNFSSLKGAINAGFEIKGQGKYLKILNFKHWKEYYHKKEVFKANFLDYHKEKWDSLVSSNEKNILNAVISNDELNNYYFDNATKNIIKQVVELKSDFKVLDYGCGIGRISNWISNDVNKVIGMDISQKMIEAAKKSAEEHNLKNVEFKLADGKSIPFKNELFDLIICCVSLKYIIDDDNFNKIMGELARVTKKGGCITIIDEVDQNGPKILNEEDLSGFAILRSSEEFIYPLKKLNFELINEYSIFLNLLSKKYRFFASLMGLKKNKGINERLLKKFIDMDLVMDDKFKKLNTKHGFHLLYFKKT